LLFLVAAGLDNKLLVNVAAGIAENIKRQPQPGTLKVYSGRELGLYYAHEECRRFAIWLKSYIDCMHFWLITRPGVCSEIFEDWQYSEALAGDFWGYVFREDHPDFNDETREFARTIQKLVGKPRSAKAAELQKRSHTAWTRFRKLREAEIAVEKAQPEKGIPMDAHWVPPAAPGGEAVQPGL